MITVIEPWQMLVATMTGWLARQQQAAVGHLPEENRILKERLGRWPSEWRVRAPAESGVAALNAVACFEGSRSRDPDLVSTESESAPAPRFDTCGESLGKGLDRGLKHERGK